MTPLVLIVGFLGSGKTTALRNLLPLLAAQGLQPHVIINDYQNARVDAELLKDLSDSVQPISGSCVCCGSRDELLSALEAFVHAPGRILLIETNGTTDSEELIEMLALEPALGRFTQPLQISLVDAKRWQKRFWHNGLEVAQARTAGFLLLSRTDEVSVERTADVRASLSRHHIHAPDVSIAQLAEELASVVQIVQNLPARDQVACDAHCDCCHDHGSHVHTHSHTHSADAHHFASLQIDLPALVERSAVEEFLQNLPSEVIRVKGLARLVDSPEEFHIFQKADFDAPVQWLPIGSTTRLPHPLAVLIGPSMDAARIQAGAIALFGAAGKQ